MDAVSYNRRDETEHYSLSGRQAGRQAGRALVSFDACRPAIETDSKSGGRFKQGAALHSGAPDGAFLQGRSGLQRRCCLGAGIAIDEVIR